MEKKRKLPNKILLISTIAAVMLSLCSFLTVYFAVFYHTPSIEAFSSNHKSYKQVGELLKDPTTATGDQPFNSSITTLINMISGSAGDATTQLASLKTTAASTPITAQTLRAKNYNKAGNQSLVVRLGGLDWIVTYVSTNTAGNLIATLWLSDNHQEAWEGKDGSIGKYYGFVNGGLYSDWSSNWGANDPSFKYPSNMYGTSYIRTETLNNPNNRTYVASGGASTLTNSTAQATSLAAHPFTLYTVSSFGLTKYLSTPDQMSWINNIQDKSLRGYADAKDYNLNNESLATTGGTFYSGCDYTGKDGYTNWGKDYLWLPSAVEIGRTDSANGLWKTNIAERTSYDGTTEKLATSVNYSSKDSANVYVGMWTRSANYNYSTGCVHNKETGNGGGVARIELASAVRPAMLLNLDEALAHSDSPAEFNITVTNLNDSNNEYLDGNGDSYSSAFESNKSKLTVQFFTTSGDFVTSVNISTSTDSTRDFGAKLTRGTMYQVRIIAPTYMRYTVKHYVDTQNDIYNSFSTSTFMAVCNGKQGVEIEVVGLQDNSWLTFYK